MYEQFTKFRTTPAGAVLKYILQKEKISQKEIAERSYIYPQRINDLINGRRKFTPETSIALEKALGIDALGYFCTIQTNFDVYSYQNEQELKITPDLSKFKQSLFWDTKMETVNWIRNYKWIIQRAFEYGNEEEIKETVRFYGREKVKEILNGITEKWVEHNRLKNREKFAI